MPASRLYMNWVDVSVLPVGGTAIPVDGVTSIVPARQSRLEKFYGDAYSFARMIKAVERQRMITIESGNIAALETIPEDTPCTVQGTLLDPRNGNAAGGGALQFTLINAVLQKTGSTGPNNKFASGSITFEAYGGTNNGVEVDPLTITAL